MLHTYFRVKIRRDIGMEVKPEAKQLDGRIYRFYFGWEMDLKTRYPGEIAYIPDDPNYPKDAPTWIASGDLEKLEPEETHEILHH